MRNDWYKTAVFYQIWIRSFADSNNDGVGDLGGVYSKLPYIRSLGVNALCFSPLYPSPRTMYCDISNYYDIHQDYGTLELFKQVIGRAHQLGMRVIMDIAIDDRKLKDELKDIMRFWLEIGVDGFKEDIVALIADKRLCLNGKSYYIDKEHSDRYLKELRRICQKYNAIQIGDESMAKITSAIGYISGPGRTMDMMIPSDDMMSDHVVTRCLTKNFGLCRLKKAFTRRQKALNGKAWNILCIENYNHSRAISRYGNENYRNESGKMLAVSYIFQKGTPVIYQGQEIGMTNIYPGSIDSYIDEASEYSFSPGSIKDSLKKIYLTNKDSARTPMQWNSSENAGFSKARPWFYLNSNYYNVNVKDELKDQGSVLNFYKKCIALKKHSLTMLFGSYKEYFRENRNIYMYERARKNIRYLVVCSFSKNRQSWKLPKNYVMCTGRLILCNYPDPISTSISRHQPRETLRPFEARIYRFRVK